MRVDLVLKFDGNLCGVVKWILLFCCVCFPEIPVAGESRSSLIVITGEVKDADGEPLPGVTVVLKGTSLGCATGTDGKFRLEIPEQKEMVLLFRFVGMKNQEVKVTGARHIRVTMVKDMKELDDVIVPGITRRRRMLLPGRLPGSKERIYYGCPRRTCYKRCQS